MGLIVSEPVCLTIVLLLDSNNIISYDIIRVGCYNQNSKIYFLLEFLLSIYKTIKYHLDRLPPKKLVQQNNLSIP